jgi:hypothetical protein
MLNSFDDHYSKHYIPFVLGVTTLKALGPGGLGDPALVIKAPFGVPFLGKSLLFFMPTEKSNGIGGIELTSIVIL